MFTTGAGCEIGCVDIAELTNITHISVNVIVVLLKRPLL